MYAEKVLSGMRPTGRLHLGHYHGALANWVRLQTLYPCLFFVADWHALTTSYDDIGTIAESTREMVIDWLACGVDPDQSTIFVQSRVPEHAELTLLLGMVTPLGWLERVPTYKDQIEKLSHKDLGTYGFLGYPLMQAADILIYRADKVPVGEDQVPHIEMTREIARRFNHLYGREPNFEEKAREAVKKLGGKVGKRFDELRKRFTEQGDADSLALGKTLLLEAASLSQTDRERLAGYLEGSGKLILAEPAALLTEASRMPGLDGQKMSKSYGNTIALRDDPDTITKKIRTMQTDPQRVRRTDPGNPDKCPVWQFHQIYSDDGVKKWVREGCQTAGIGCLECKQPIVEAVLKEQAPMRERACRYQDDPALVERILREGSDKARALAQDTMRDVRAAMGLV
jgi:tryptophanyl-tRNA synthetase